MNVLIKKINKNAILPEFAHTGDAGLDIFSVENKLVKRGKIELIKTGLTIQLPPNTEAQIRPRSGLALKNGITVLNTPGTIDEGYRGEIGVIIINHGEEDFQVQEGMKIAQMVIKPTLHVDVIEVDELDSTERSVLGFGSSGNSKKV